MNGITGEQYMKQRLFRWGFVMVLATLLSIILVIPAQAADPAILKLKAPVEATLGSSVTVTTVLEDSGGSAIVGVTIILWSPVDFLGTIGAIQHGEATTDAQGEAIFSYEPRTEGIVTLNAYFPGNEQHEFTQGTMELTVQGSTQLYHEEVGVYVPGIGIWILVAILGTVWFIYFMVFVFLMRIVRDKSENSQMAGGHSE
jgi:hypothetical protein